MPNNDSKQEPANTSGLDQDTASTVQNQGAAKTKQPPTKKYYTVKVETLTPVIYSYRVLAESPEEAIKISADAWKQASQSAPPQILSGKMKRLKATVYEYGTSLIKLIKNL